MQRIYGGQVVAQALSGGLQDRGRPHLPFAAMLFHPPRRSRRSPVLYQVERSRDGRSFATRRVLAIQKGEQIFNMACSFQSAGGRLRASKRDAASAAARQRSPRIRRHLRDSPPRRTPVGAGCWRSARSKSAPSTQSTCAQPKPAPPQQTVWFRARDDVGDDIALNQIAARLRVRLFACSAPRCARTALAGVRACKPPASITSIWFHRPTNLSAVAPLCAGQPVRVRRARLQSRPRSIAADGALVASTAQEGLIRQRARP